MMKVREQLKRFKMPYPINFLCEASIAGLVLSCLLAMLACTSDDVARPALTAAAGPVAPDVIAAPHDSPVPQGSPAPEIIPASEDAPPEAIASARGIDPIASPHFFDIIDAEEELANMISHVPNDDMLLRSNGSLRTVPSRTSHIVVDKIGHTLTLFSGGELIRQYGVAVGKASGNKSRDGDMRTPEGTFAVTQIHDASTWVHDFGDGKGPIEGAYGPLFIRLATAPWSGIGIHGTHDPGSIGTDATEGCIRMHNDDLLELADLISGDTTVTIHPN